MGVCMRPPTGLEYTGPGLNFLRQKYNLKVVFSKKEQNKNIKKKKHFEMKTNMMGLIPPHCVPFIFLCLLFSFSQFVFELFFRPCSPVSLTAFLIPHTSTLYFANGILSNICCPCSFWLYSRCICTGYFTTYFSSVVCLIVSRRSFTFLYFFFHPQCTSR